MEGKSGNNGSEHQPSQQHRSFYMTNQQKKQSPQTEIIETYTKLNKTIDDLEVHIEDAIKKHEAQFLFAYRNHMKKIKKELAELRKRSDQQQKQFSSNDKIVYLEKQITIFREEALKLYDKLEQKSHETEELRMQLKIAEKENVNYEKDVKELVRKIKTIELQLHQQNEEPASLLDSPRSKKTPTPNPNPARYLPSILPSDAKPTTSVASSSSMAFKPIEAILQQYLTDDSLSSAVRDITSWARAYEQELKERFSRTTMQNRKPLPVPLLQNNDYELKEWFLECVKTIKKQIFKRKQQEALPLSHISDINDFLSIDKLRLLELFLTNEQLLSHMYLKMFPDRLTELRELLAKKPQSQRDINRVRNTSLIDRQAPEYEYEQIDKPSVVLRKQRQPKSLLRNRVFIKNGKLNFTNS